MDNRHLYRAFIILLMMVVLGLKPLRAQSAWDGITKPESLAAASIQGSGTEADPYLIGNANQFVAFGALANNSTAYWKLTADINLGGHPWPYAGNAPKTFKGHLDGQNHTVRNYTITPTTKQANALFGIIQGSSATSRAEVKNLTISKVAITQTSDLAAYTYTGALAGRLDKYVDIVGVHVDSVTISCTNLTGANYIGALAGLVQNNSTITNCSLDSPKVTVAGNVAAASYIGAAIGRLLGASGTGMSSISGLTVASPSVTINNVSVKDTYIGAAIGQIHNYSSVATLTVSSPTLTYNNANAPNVSLNLGSLVGGIFGVAAQQTAVTAVTLTGTAQLTIGSDNNVQNVRAGVVGYVSSNVRLEDWTVAASSVQVNGNLATSNCYLGGFLGYAANATDAPLYLKNINITGNSTVGVSGNVDKNSQLGGFVGCLTTATGASVSLRKARIKGDATVTVGGNVTATSQLGGFAGYLATADANNTSLEVDTLSVWGTAKVVVEGNVTAASHLGGVVGQIVGRSKANNSVTVDSLTAYKAQVLVKGTNNGASYYGGLVGYASRGCMMDLWKADSTDVTIRGDVSSAIVGGIVGGFVAAVGYPTRVTNVTVRKASITAGTSAANVVAGAKMGAVGVITDNVTLDGWTLSGRSKLTLNAKLATSTSYVGGFLGQVTADNNAPVTIANTTLAVDSLMVKDNVEVACHLGGFVGSTGGKSNGEVTWERLRVGTSCISVAGNVSVGSTFGGLAGVTGTSSSYRNHFDDCQVGKALLTFEGNITATSYVGGAFGNCQGAAGYPVVANDIVVTKPTITFNGTSVATYVGGLAGQVTNSVTATNWSATSPKITFLNAITSTSYVGGGIGYINSSYGAPSLLDGIAVVQDTLSINGTAVKDVSVGGVFGRIGSYASVAHASASKSRVTLNGNITVATHFGAVTGYLTGNASLPTILDHPSSTYDTLIINGNVTVNGLNLGGIAGYQTAAAHITDASVLGSQLVLNGNVTASGSLKIGGVSGYQTTSSILGATVDGLDVVLNSNNANEIYVGGAVGYMPAGSAPFTTLERAVVKNVKIRTLGSHTYARGNKPLVVGGVVAHMANSSATQRSELNKCVVQNIDINLAGFAPEAGNTSGSTYNQQQNAFVVGGVVGRIATPYSLPEHLYFSGKIYAPFAAVGPVVGVFLKNIATATYLYDDYSGVNATTLSASEWDKADSWYFADYKLGLSPELVAATRTKNYTATTSQIGGVDYLSIGSTTLPNSNSIGGTDKLSHTVLAYTDNNSNTNTGIYPQWNSNNSLYPAYYMYLMQGVNRGTFNNQVDIDQLLLGFTFAPLMHRLGDDQSGYLFSVDLNGFDPGSDYSVSYQWYESDQSTAIAGGTTSSLSVSKASLDAMGGTVYCVVTVSGANMSPFSVTLRGSYVIVVFVSGSSGADNLGSSRVRGWTPTTPVRTIDHANSLLASTQDGGTIDNNFIVVMGTLNTNCFVSRGFNPATLTGIWDGTDYSGLITLGSNNDDGLNLADDPTQMGSHNYVLADTKFQYLTFKSTGDGKGNGQQVNFHCHGRDVWFGKGLRLSNFGRSPVNHTNIYDEEVPNFAIILTSTNLAHPEESYWTRSKPQVLTIESGHYSRILGGRFTNNFFANPQNRAHTIQATPLHPAWAVVNIDIDPANEMTSVEGLVYPCDVNLLCAGLTDGTTFEDMEINIHGGIVNTIVGANQGNSVRNGNKTFTPLGGISGNFGHWPNSSFFGRTVVNVEQDPDLKPIVIRNIYGGGLGRNVSSSSGMVVDTYEYGRAEINVRSGRVLGNIYGGGVGGVLGTNPWDPRVPYATSAPDDEASAIQSGVQYGGMPEGSPWATVTLHNRNDDGSYSTELLDLSQSSTTINISGGTIGGGGYGTLDPLETLGNIYGGGDGEVPDMDAKIALQGVGSVFGTANINITGGTILGSVYGGSKGSAKYFNGTNDYGQTITHIAEMNGTININITGTEEHYPSIAGNIYGGGKGVASISATDEYLPIATAGNSALGDEYRTTINMLVDLPESHPYNGKIFGGGEMGAVDGDINMVIRGGHFNGEIFGAGLGEKAHLDKAKLTGNTTISTGAPSVDDVLQSHPVTIVSAIYGGGDMSQVVGQTHVNIHHGNVTGDVFGGGKGRLQSDDDSQGFASYVDYGKVTDNTYVTINNPSANNQLTGNVYGGGALGVVEGSTRVEMHVGTVDGSVFGGGMGDALTPGSLAGKVVGSTQVLVGTESCSSDGHNHQSHTVAVTQNVYGGGNAAPVQGSTLVEVNAKANDGTTVGGFVFGGGYGANAMVNANTHVRIVGQKASVGQNVYGGGNGGKVLGNTHVVIGE